MRQRLSRRQRDILTKIANGMRLLAAPDMTCWLHSVSDGKYEPVERVSNRMAERLVLGNLVRAVGHLAPGGWDALGRHQCDYSRE
jgi:hypothetical protein